MNQDQQGNQRDRRWMQFFSNDGIIFRISNIIFSSGPQQANVLLKY